MKWSISFHQNYRLLVDGLGPQWKKLVQFQETILSSAKISSTVQKKIDQSFIIFLSLVFGLFVHKPYGG